MNGDKKLRHEQKQDQSEEQIQSVQSTRKEFSSVEELLRHDAAQIVVPGSIAARLNKSIANESKPATSWWKRLFSHE